MQHATTTSSMVARAQDPDTRQWSTSVPGAARRRGASGHCTKPLLPLRAVGPRPPVFYNYKRGETRGPRKPGEDYQAKGLGDCIDCYWCVQVCPVDIDIRDGLQPECIDCGLCVDACNTVMDKMGYERGLISFTTEDAIENGKTRVLRPRLLGYAALLLAMISVFVYTVSTRVPVGMEVLRDRGVRMYRIAGDEVQNVYTIKINNMDRNEHIFDLRVEGKYNFEIKGYRPSEVEEGEILTVPIRVVVKRSELKDVQTPVFITVEARGNPDVRATHSTSFIGPASAGR